MKIVYEKCYILSGQEKVKIDAICEALSKKTYPCYNCDAIKRGKCLGVKLEDILANKIQLYPKITVNPLTGEAIEEEASNIPCIDFKNWREDPNFCDIPSELSKEEDLIKIIADTISYNISIKQEQEKAAIVSLCKNKKEKNAFKIRTDYSYTFNGKNLFEIEDDD